MSKKRIVVGMTGASGVVYGVRLLEELNRNSSCETHLIMTGAARKNIELETEYAPQTVEGLADVVYENDNIAAATASGSFLTEGMVVIPCTVKTLSGIAHSYNDTLLTRTADVTLKEQRRLVLVVRETPLHRGHLQLMMTAADNGATILPPMPAFYHRPQSIMDIVNQTVGKVLDSLRIEHDLFNRWEGE